MDETTTILVETRGNVGIITLNRPDILNAVNLVMLNEIAYQVETWEYDDNIRAIVIKGSDKAFAAGIDIKEMSQEVSQQSLALNAWYNEFSRIENCSKPIIAAVAGYALGLGCELALVSDIVLAADNARFGHPEISLGILPGFGRLQPTDPHHRQSQNHGSYLNRKSPKRRRGDVERPYQQSGCPSGFGRRSPEGSDENRLAAVSGCSAGKRNNQRSQRNEPAKWNRTGSQKLQTEYEYRRVSR